MVVKSDGEHVCDERCYNARGRTCSCICGGKNHGMGLNNALRNEGMTNEEADSINESREAEDLVEHDDPEYCEECGSALDSDGLCPECDFQDDDESDPDSSLSDESGAIDE